MKRYRKKREPPVEAVQWTGSKESREAVSALLDPIQPTFHGVVFTADGIPAGCAPKDRWIIRDPSDGSLDSLKPEEFQATYEEVTDGEGVERPTADSSLLSTLSDPPPLPSTPRQREEAAMSSETTKSGLQAKEVMLGWDGEARFLERVTVTEQTEAEKLFAAASEVSIKDVEVQPTHMRRVTAWDGDAELNVEDTPCWLECEADHPDAVPFWKDAP